MKHLFALIVVVSSSLCAVEAAAAQSCEPTPQRHTHFLTGEISGKHTFVQPIMDKWTLEIRPGRYGWHFRNAANTDLNIGDVNAPQEFRLFFFSPALSETGGFKPSSPNGDQPDEKAGRAALTILDMGLADHEPGAKARLTYLKFHVCLSWPKSDETIGEEI